MTVSAESSVAVLIGEAYSGASAAPTSPELEYSKFEFDDEFQTKVAVLTLRDTQFMRKTSHLIRPEYFENNGEAALVNIGLKFFETYKQTPDRATALNLFKMAIGAKEIRGDMVVVAKEAFSRIYGKTADTSNANYVAETVSAFARHQAVSRAILSSVDLLGKKQFEKIERDIKMAVEVGINSDGEGYDYWEKIEERSRRRTEEALGTRPKMGIATGNLQMDQLLYHHGWGRKELNVILGGPKSGKTTALIGFGRAASLAGYNVLYVSCEVSADILADRFDASISDTSMKELIKNISAVEGKVASLKARAGQLKIHEYPSGTLSPNMLRQLIERYKSPSINADGTVRDPIIFDLIITDYADIMAPNHRTNDPIENSKAIYLDLRAIAHENNAAMLTATQSNREGAKATVTRAEHVADDYNKVRTVDLMISINATEEERSAGEARLFFAASRNQEGGFTIFITQNLAKMQFMKSIVKVE